MPIITDSKTAQDVANLKSGEESSSNAMNSSMWGGLALAASNIFQTATTTLNPKVRENQLAIAEANARTAEANARQQTASSFDPRFIIGAVVVTVLIIIVLKATSK